jgi:transcriptional regulator with PAS, ATPase and Fis domain
MTCTATPTSGLLEPIPGLPPGDVIFGISPVMGKIRQKLEKATGAKIAVLRPFLTELMKYPWPEIIRELENLIKKLRRVRIKRRSTSRDAIRA